MAQKIFGITIGKKDDLDSFSSSTDKKSFSLPFLKKKKEEEVIDVADLDLEFVPTLPAVNVIPLTTLEVYKNKDITKKFIRAGIITASVIVLILGYTNIGELAHQSNLTQLEAEGDKLRQDINTVTPYKTYKTEVETKIKTISTIMTTDIDVQKIVDFVFSTAAANSIVIDSLDIKILAKGGGDCIVTNPFQTSSVLGCVSVSGTQPNAESVNAFFSTIASTKGYTDDFINSTQYSEDPTSNNFSGSFSFTAELYSNKYNNMLLPIDTLIANGITFEAPAPATNTTNGSTTNGNSTNGSTTNGTNGSTTNGSTGSSTSSPSPTQTGIADDPNYKPPVIQSPAPTTGGQ